MNLIMFSKNRPAQLELLLRSMHRYVDGISSENVYVISSFDEMYADEYYALANKYGISLMPDEGIGFKDLLVHLVGGEEIMFLVDDNVFINKFNPNVARDALTSDPDLLCYSTRLNMNMDYCYAYKTRMNAPKTDGTNRWLWKNAHGDYGYPMSLDGNVFRTENIYPLLQKLEYSNPNQLEGALAGNPPVGRYMACGDRSSVIGVPWNKVQTENDNRCAGESLEEMNEKYIHGERISMLPFKNLKPNAVHIEVPLVWE